MSIPNLIPHKTLYISGYIYSYYAFVFIFEFPEHISKHILQFHTSCLIYKGLFRDWKDTDILYEKVKVFKLLSFSHITRGMRSFKTKSF